jgi:hypothetical protein
MTSIAVVVVWDAEPSGLERYLHGCAWQLTPADGLYVVAAPLPDPGALQVRPFGSLAACAEAIQEKLVVVLNSRAVLAPYVLDQLRQETTEYAVALGPRRWVSAPHCGCTWSGRGLSHPIGPVVVSPSQCVFRADVFRSMVAELALSRWEAELFTKLQDASYETILLPYPVAWLNLGELHPPRARVGVVIPVFHEPLEFTRRAVASCYQQLRAGEEIIIVPGEGVTADLSFIEEYRLEGVRVVPDPAGAKVGSCRNKGVAALHAPWVKFLDADDVLAPWALHALCFPYPAQVQVVHGGQVFVIDGGYAGVRSSLAHRPEGMIFANPLIPSCTLVRRDAVLALGGFDSRLGFEEDYDLWLRLADRFGLEAFQPHPQVFDFYWMNTARRKIAWEQRDYLVEGQPVRDYFNAKYGIACVFEEDLPRAGGNREAKWDVPEILA